MDGVRWLAAEDHFPLGYWVLFARSLEPAELVRRLAPVTPVAAAVTREDVDEVEDAADGVVVRAGASAGWAFGIVEGGPIGRAPDQALGTLSAGTSAVELWRTVNADTGFALAEDGRTVCRFEPGSEHERSGAAPDRLLPALRGAGLVLPDGSTPFEHGEDLPDALLRVLAMAESEFGLDLPQRTVLEDALTAGVLDTRPAWPRARPHRRDQPRSGAHVSAELGQALWITPADHTGPGRVTDWRRVEPCPGAFPHLTRGCCCGTSRVSSDLSRRTTLRYGRVAVPCRRAGVQGDPAGRRVVGGQSGMRGPSPWRARAFSSARCTSMAEVTAAGRPRRVLARTPSMTRGGTAFRAHRVLTGAVS
ncbi:DUF6461 domain-containing protein [Streptomyces sp. NPDC001348]